MAIVDISPSEAQRPYLQAGEYGPGLEHEADTDIWVFEYPATERPCPFNKEKAWVAEDPTNHRHAFVGIRIVTQNGDRFFVDKWIRGAGLKKFLLQAGVPITDKPGGGFQFNDDDVVRKLAGVVMSEPSEYQGEMRNGFVNSVLSK